MSDQAPRAYRTIDARWQGALRLCSMCGQAKEPEAFRASRRSRDGRRSECQDCDRKRNTAQRREARALAKQPPCPHCGGTGRAVSFARPETPG